LKKELISSFRLSFILSLIIIGLLFLETYLMTHPPGPIFLFHVMLSWPASKLLGDFEVNELWPVLTVLYLFDFIVLFIGVFFIKVLQNLFRSGLKETQHNN
jgi:hypothetical protein